MVSLAKDAISKPNTVDVIDAVADPGGVCLFFFPKNVSNYCLEERRNFEF
jgi:peroxiredoxin